MWQAWVHFICCNTQVFIAVLPQTQVKVICVMLHTIEPCDVFIPKVVPIVSSYMSTQFHALITSTSTSVEIATVSLVVDIEAAVIIQP